ncbi:MAG: hypothetical protein AAB276_00805 [Pseudomonadota bacterium]
MTKAKRKVILIVSIMLLALTSLLIIISHSKKLAETDSEASVFKTSGT